MLLCFDQLEFLGAGQLLDLHLAAHGFLAGLEGLEIGHRDRAVGTGIFSALSGVVGGQTPVEIVGPAGIKGAVGTFEDIGIVQKITSRIVSQRRQKCKEKRDQRIGILETGASRTRPVPGMPKHAFEDQTILVVHLLQSQTVVTTSL